MTREITDLLVRQHEIAWSLASYHLETLSTRECLWRPSTRGLHVSVLDDVWRGEWPDHEGYDLGPPSIAWLVWHIGYWWSMVINHSFEDSTLSQESVTSPSHGDEIRAWLLSLHIE